jgi:hypothetical protein
MSIAGADAGSLLHVRIDAKRKALNALAVGVKTVSHDRNNDTKPVGGAILFSQPLERMAGTTGLEPAASAVTGQRSNQLNYVPGFADRNCQTGGQCRTRTCDLLLVRQAL